MYVSLPKFKYLQSLYSFLRLWHQWVSTPSRGVPKTLVASGVSQMSRIRKRKADSNFLTQLHHTESSQTYSNQTNPTISNIHLDLDWRKCEFRANPNIFLVGLGAEGIIASLPANPVPGLTKHETTARLPFLIKWPYTNSSGKKLCKQTNYQTLLIARVRTKMVKMKDYPLYRIRMASHYDWLEVLPTQCL